MPGPVVDLTDIVRAHGVRGGAVKILDFLRVYRRMALMRVPLDSLAPRESALAGKVLARELMPTTEDLASYRRFRSDTPEGELRARFEAGAACFVTLVDGAVAASMWSIKGGAHIDYLGCDLDLGIDGGYAFDVFTVPALRGNDLASWSGEQMRRRMAELGCTHVVSAQVPENSAAMGRSVRRRDERLGTIGVLGVGPWRKAFVQLKLFDALPRAVLRPCRRSGWHEIGCRTGAAKSP